MPLQAFQPYLVVDISFGCISSIGSNTSCSYSSSSSHNYSNNISCIVVIVIVVVIKALVVQ